MPSPVDQEDLQNLLLREVIKEELKDDVKDYLRKVRLLRDPVRLDDLIYDKYKFAASPSLTKTANIVEKDGMFYLYTKDGSSILGKHKTRKGALAQERAIMAHKHASVDLTKIGQVYGPTYPHGTGAQTQALLQATEMGMGPFQQPGMLPPTDWSKFDSEPDRGFFEEAAALRPKIVKPSEEVLAVIGKGRPLSGRGFQRELLKSLGIIPYRREP